MTRVKVKIKKSQKPGKRLTGVYTNPKTGRENVVHFGQVGSNLNPDKTTQKAFFSRHRGNDGPAGQLSKRNWKGKGLKPGDTAYINI